MSVKDFRNSSLTALVSLLDVTFTPLKMSCRKQSRMVYQTERQEVQRKNCTLSKSAPFSDFFILQLRNRKILGKKLLDVDYRGLKR